MLKHLIAVVAFACLFAIPAQAAELPCTNVWSGNKLIKTGSCAIATRQNDPVRQSLCERTPKAAGCKSCE